MTIPMSHTMSGYRWLNPLLVAHHNGTLRERPFTGREINVRDAKGRNALYWAIWHDNRENIDFLLDEGICLNVENQKHALFHAIECGSAHAVDLLTLRGLYPDRIRDECGHTPLMMAAAKGKLAICRLLLERGADPFLTDIHFETAADLALKNGYPIVSVEISRWMDLRSYAGNEEGL